MSEPHGPTPNPYDPTQFAPTSRPMPPLGGQFPPPWPPGPSPQRNRRLIWALLGLVIVLTVTAVVLGVTVVGRDRQENTHATAESGSGDTAPVPVSVLETLLPAADVVRDATADPGIGIVDKGESMFPGVVEEKSCQGMSFVAAGPVYAGSGWTSVRWQIWNSPAEPKPEKLEHQMLTSVVSYPSAQAARSYYNKQRTDWQSCSDRTVNMRVTNLENPTDAFWTVGAVTENDGVLSTTGISEGGAGWSCGLTTAVRNNIITQLNLCALTPSGDAAQKVLASITAKIDAAA